MCILEHELLVNRKKRCWNRYYNNSLGDPRYVDQYGENNPRWKGGITYDMRAYEKKRSAERRAKRRAETGYAQGYSQAKNKTERQGVGTLKEFI